MPIPIRVSEGAAEYATVTITEATGADIHTDPVTVAVTGANGTATVWLTPTLVSAVNATVVVRLLITSDLCPRRGWYDLHVKVVDGPETVIRVMPEAIQAV